MLAAIPQVKGVVEIWRIIALVVLEDGLQFVERFHGLRFWRGGSFVLVPQGDDFRAQWRVEVARQGMQVVALLRRLSDVDTQNDWIEFEQWESRRRFPAHHGK